MPRKSEKDEYDDGNLPFAKAEITRLMKEHLEDDKQISKRVKIGMNLFLGNMLKEVCEKLNKYPYMLLEYHMFEEAIYPYENIYKIDKEKIRIIKHMESIKADCEVLKEYVKESMKSHDVDPKELELKDV